MVDVFGSVFERGSVIFRQGDMGDIMYIIQSGSVEVSQKQGDDEVVLSILGKGDFFGEMALLKQDRRSATITALRTTRLLSLTRDSLFERMQDDEGVILHLLKGLILRLQRGNEKLKNQVRDDETILSITEVNGDVKTTDLHVEDAVTIRDEIDISTEELADIWDVEEGVTWFEPGETIFLEGDPGDTMYIILSGTVEIYLGSGENRQVLDHLKSGDFFGEMAIIADCQRSASSVAVTRTQIMSIKREDVSNKLKSNPELFLHIVQALCVRLQRINTILADPKSSLDVVRQSWRPLIKKADPARISIVSLSTCAGCSAVLLDNDFLSELLTKADIVYSTMLMDQNEMPEADITLIDGVVRLKEDQERLEEARRKTRFLVSWGSCACFGGIPSQANRFELEELIEETYGHTDDTYAYYLSGKAGVRKTTYQETGLSLLRKAFKLSDFTRVDYYLSGCPPTYESLLLLLNELTGKQYKETNPIICGQCGRKPSKTALGSLDFQQRSGSESICLNSLGVPCMGFMIKGGCGAICPRNGFPCWGCRGPSKSASKKLADGQTFENIMVKGLIRRCRMEPEQSEPIIRLLRKQSHYLFDFEPNFISNLSRIR